MAAEDAVAKVVEDFNTRFGVADASIRQLQQQHHEQSQEISAMITKLGEQLTQKFEVTDREIKEKYEKAAALAESTNLEMKAKLLQAEEKVTNKGLPNSDEEGDQRGPDVVWKSDNAGTGGWSNTNLPGKGNPSGSSGTHPRNNDRPERNRNLEEKSFRRIGKI